MTALRWNETTREALTAVLPEALVLLATGATEQHGPHLPTGTDILLSRTVTERAADRASPISQRPLVLAPPLPFGASDHHRRFGGTLSLRVPTMITVLSDPAGQHHRGRRPARDDRQRTRRQQRRLPCRSR
jgi:creatinine amidohydrolase